MKNITLGIIVLLLVIVGAIFLLNNGTEETYVAPIATTTPETTSPATTTTSVASSTADGEENPTPTGRTIIGTSAGGNDITAYHYGTGPKEILLIAGVHGGYSYNTSLLAFELNDWLEENEQTLTTARVTIIPVLNPDGLKAVTGKTGRFDNSDVASDEATKIAGRFNSNDVDLNRNFDCDWKSVGTWQSRSVSGGSKAFSEPESEALRTYIDSNEPDAVVVWYAAAGGVYSSSCGGAPSADSIALTKTFATASGYTGYESFDNYEVNGDLVNWLAKEGIPAISVLLTDRTTTEFNKNLAGVRALIAAE